MAKPKRRRVKRRVTFKPGDKLRVTPMGSGLRKSLPASNWLTKERTVTAIDEGRKGGLDVYDVRVNGEEQSVYGTQIKSIFRHKKR